MQLRGLRALFRRACTRLIDLRPQAQHFGLGGIDVCIVGLHGLFQARLELRVDTHQTLLLCRSPSDVLLQQGNLRTQRRHLRVGRWRLHECFHAR